MKYEVDPSTRGTTFLFLVSSRAEFDFSLALVLTEKKKKPNNVLTYIIHISGGRFT